MRTLTETEFLRWAESKGVGVGPRYPDSAVLEFAHGSDSRFWTVPPEPERRPYLITSILDLMGDWQTCYVWRHSGSWPDPTSVDRRRVNDVVELRILQGLGMPLGTAAVVAFARNELDTLATLVFCTTVFGWSVVHDLYLVPDHAQYILETDHHDVIHVSFRARGEVERWVSSMAQRGFHLPDELPDPTFKRPSWMPE